MKRRSRFGFTLVEMLITVAIFSIVLILIVETLVGSFKNFDMRSERIDILSHCQLLTAYMRRDLRTAIWSEDAPLQLRPNGMSFYRVAGVKVGTDGNIGMPEIRLVHYEWDASSKGIIRRSATPEHLREKIFLPARIEQGGFKITPISSISATSIDSPRDSGLSFRLSITCKNGVKSETSLVVFSRFMAAASRDSYAQHWYQNWQLHPSTSPSLSVLGDYHSGVLDFTLDDTDQLIDSGLAMGDSGLLPGGGGS